MIGAVCRRRTRVVAAVLAPHLLLLGCGAGWHRPPELVPDPLAPRQQVEVWHGGRAERWHAVVMDVDSVSGIPFLLPVTCDSCRVAVPRAAVDSLRLGNPVAGFWKTAGLILAIPTLFLIWACSKGCYEGGT